MPCSGAAKILVRTGFEADMESPLGQAIGRMPDHAELTAQFGRVLKEFEEAEFSFVWAVKGLQMKQLLVEHLLKEDLKYQSFLQSKPVPR